MSSSVTRAGGVLPSNVAALMTRLRNVTGPSRAGANTSGTSGRAVMPSTLARIVGLGQAFHQVARHAQQLLLGRRELAGHRRGQPGVPPGHVPAGPPPGSATAFAAAGRWPARPASPPPAGTDARARSAPAASRPPPPAPHEAA